MPPETLHLSNPSFVAHSSVSRSKHFLSPFIRTSLVVQLVKNLPAMQETPVRFLDWEDPPGEGIGYPLQYSWPSLVAQTVKNPPTMRETWVRSLGWEDPLEGDMATHSSILAWRVPWQRSLAGCGPWGRSVGCDRTTGHCTRSSSPCSGMVSFVWLRGRASLHSSQASQMVLSFGKQAHIRLKLSFTAMWPPPHRLSVFIFPNSGPSSSPLWFTHPFLVSAAPLCVLQGAHVRPDGQSNYTRLPNLGLRPQTSALAPALL